MWQLSYLWTNFVFFDSYMIILYYIILIHRNIVKKNKFWFFTNLRMRGSAMLIQWEEEEKSGHENSKKIKVFLRENKACHYHTDPYSDKTWWMTFQKDKKQNKKFTGTCRNMASKVGKWAKNSKNGQVEIICAFLRPSTWWNWIVFWLNL